jgi:phosphoribosylformimino-5-aminoimidazole carboxamide ribotide isomerase
VVDLNGAFEGESINRAAVEAILKATKNPVQLGGGIRTLAQIESLAGGRHRPRHPRHCRPARPGAGQRQPPVPPGQIAVGIDAKGGKVAVEGWAETSDMKATELAKAFEGCGVAAIVATDIGRDGLKTGVNVPFTAELANTVSIPVIASGGVASVYDIRALMAADAPIAGSILGRALYDGDIVAAEALEVAK